MTRSKAFAAGQLVWISQRIDHWCRGYIQTERGYPTVVDLDKGAPCTVIRKALAKDLGVYSRHSHRGKSVGRRIAEHSWLVLHSGRPTVIDEAWLCKRRYTPRKKAQQVCQR